MEGEIVEIISTIIIDGVVYVIKKGIDGLISFFRDEDGDGLPDLPEPDFQIPIEERVDKCIIIVAPDGTITVYDEDGNITPEDCDMAYSLWVADNNVMSKQLDNYSVTEGLLALLLLFTVLNFIRGLFVRKDVFR